MNYKAINLYGNHRRRWTKSLVLKAIRDLQRMNSYYVKKNDNPLWRAAVRYFGSWGEAVEAAGFDYEAIKRQPGTTPTNKGSGGICKEHGCTEPHHAKGRCRRHYSKHQLQ